MFLNVSLLALISHGYVNLHNNMLFDWMYEWIRNKSLNVAYIRESPLRKPEDCIWRHFIDCIVMQVSHV